MLQTEETAWRVSKEDLQRNKRYQEYLDMNEEMLQKTDTDFAPWTIIEAEHRDFAAAKIMTVVANRLQAELDKQKNEEKKPVIKDTGESESFRSGRFPGWISPKKLSRERVQKRLQALQERIGLLHNELYRLRIPVVLGFEGWDAGGKGGAIKRLTSHLDPRGYLVHPTASPNDTERQYHYLWRFWKDMPKDGHITIFDRTWYGRVMVERIEGFCTKEEWKRAYRKLRNGTAPGQCGGCRAQILDADR